MEHNNISSENVTNNDVNASDAPGTTLSTMFYDEFIDTLVNKAQIRLNEKGYVYQNIKINERDGDKTISIIFPCDSSDDAYGMSCLSRYAWETYNAQIENAITNNDADFDPQELMTTIVNELVESYNQSHIDFIKSSSALKQFDEKMHDDEYLLSHVYPGIFNTSADFNGSFYEDKMQMTYPGNNSLKYIFSVFDVNFGLSTFLASDTLKDHNFDANNFLQTSLVNLNNIALKHLTVTHLDEVLVKNLLPFEVANTYVKHLAADVNNIIPDYNTGVYVASFNDVPLSVSSILLSRTAMLRVSKVLKAKNKVLFIPLSDSDALVKCIDDCESYDMPSAKFMDAVTKIINPQDIHNPMLPTLTAPILYNVITGDFEYHTATST